jgi:hypothetical protein
VAAVVAHTAQATTLGRRTSQDVGAGEPRDAGKAAPDAGKAENDDETAAEAKGDERTKFGAWIECGSK